MKPKKKRKRSTKPVIQQHHPVAENRTEEDELWTIPLKRSHHLFLWRSIQHTKNTWENLEYIRRILDSIYYEYLRRLRELTILERKKEQGGLKKNKIQGIK